MPSAASARQRPEPTAVLGRLTRAASTGSLDGRSTEAFPPLRRAGHGDGFLRPEAHGVRPLQDLGWRVSMQSFTSGLRHRAAGAGVVPGAVQTSGSAPGRRRRLLLLATAAGAA